MRQCAAISDRCGHQIARRLHNNHQDPNIENNLGRMQRKRKEHALPPREDSKRIFNESDHLGRGGGICRILIKG